MKAKTPDPADLAAIAERFRIKQDVDWKKLPLESLLEMPYEHFRRVSREDVQGALSCSLQSVQTAEAQPFSMSFTVAGRGQEILRFESTGVTTEPSAPSALLEAVDGEVTLEFSQLVIAAKELKQKGFKQAGPYHNAVNLYLEHVPAPEPAEPGNVRIVRGHFYYQFRPYLYLNPTPIPLRLLLPLRQQEQEFFELASGIQVRERYFPENNRANQQYWSTLNLKRRNGTTEFHYEMSTAGTAGLKPQHQERPKGVLETLQRVVAAEKIFISDVARV